MFTHAITRKPGMNFAQGITASKHESPNYELIQKQHEAYISALKSLGLEVAVLDSLPDYPDAYFVEDTAVVTPEIAVITNPGAQARNGEQKSVAPVLAQYRKIARINPPGTIDGGDVLIAGLFCFIGISERTNSEVAHQLKMILENYGYTCMPIPVSAGLHLKSSVNFAGQDLLLITSDYASRPEFNKFEKIVVDKTESYASNSLWINDTLIIPAGFPKTNAYLTSAGFSIIELDISEARKMDGGLTCMSIRF